MIDEPQLEVLSYLWEEGRGDGILLNVFHEIPVIIYRRGRGASVYTT
jgi:hypothetical protein